MRRTPAWPPPIQIAGTPVASLAWTTSVLETPNRRIQAIRVPATWTSLPVHFPKAGDFIRMGRDGQNLGGRQTEKTQAASEVSRFYSLNARTLSVPCAYSNAGSSLAIRS